MQTGAITVPMVALYTASTGGIFSLPYFGGSLYLRHVLLPSQSYYLLRGSLDSLFSLKPESYRVFFSIYGTFVVSQNPHFVAAKQDLCRSPKPSLEWRILLLESAEGRR